MAKRRKKQWAILLVSRTQLGAPICYLGEFDKPGEVFYDAEGLATRSGDRPKTFDRRKEAEEFRAKLSLGEVLPNLSRRYRPFLVAVDELSDVLVV